MQTSLCLHRSGSSLTWLHALWPTIPLCCYTCQMMDPFGSTDNSLSNSCQSIDQALDRWVIMCCVWFISLICIDFYVRCTHSHCGPVLLSEIWDWVRISALVLANVVACERARCEYMHDSSQKLWARFVNGVEGEQSSLTLLGGGTLPMWTNSRITLLLP